MWYDLPNKKSNQGVLIDDIIQCVLNEDNGIDKKPKKVTSTRKKVLQ